MRLYKEHIKLAAGLDDPTSRRMLQDILADEERHLHDWGTILEKSWGAAERAGRRSNGLLACEPRTAAIVAAGAKGRAEMGAQAEKEVHRHDRTRGTASTRFHRQSLS